jgi:hypothetical protein
MDGRVKESGTLEIHILGGMNVDGIQSLIKSQIISERGVQ